MRSEETCPECAEQFEVVSLKKDATCPTCGHRFPRTYQTSTAKPASKPAAAPTPKATEWDEDDDSPRARPKGYGFADAPGDRDEEDDRRRRPRRSRPRDEYEEDYDDRDEGPRFGLETWLFVAACAGYLFFMLLSLIWRDMAMVAAMIGVPTGLAYTLAIHVMLFRNEGPGVWLLVLLLPFYGIFFLISHLDEYGIVWLKAMGFMAAGCLAVWWVEHPRKGPGAAQVDNFAGDPRAKQAGPPADGPLPADLLFKGRDIPGWGLGIDPDFDCTFSWTARNLKVSVPGTLHDLQFNEGRTNAPRVMCEVDGDFITAVKVWGQFKPQEKSTNPRSVPYNGAGFLLWNDSDNTLRFERFCWLKNGGYATGASLEYRKNGRNAVVFNNTMPEGDVHLGIERRGGRLVCSTSSNGETWTELKTVEAEWPAGIKVGLAVINTSSLPLEVEFQQFRIKHP